MRQINDFDILTGLSVKKTFIRIIVTDKRGKESETEMLLRHALQAMKVQPKRFKLAKGEKLPKGVTVSMVPPGTTLKDVKEFEKNRGKVGKVTKTHFDNVLDAIERGVEIEDVVSEDPGEDDAAGSMMSEDAPHGFVPSNVDLEPADSMKERSTEDEGKRLQAIADENAASNIKPSTDDLVDAGKKTTPEFEDIKEKELNFTGADTATTQYKKSDLKVLAKDKLQAILLTLPAFNSMADKMQKMVMKANKDSLVDNIVQLSKKTKQHGKIK